MTWPRRTLAIAALLALPLGCTSSERAEQTVPPPAYLDARDIYAEPGEPRVVDPSTGPIGSIDPDGRDYDTGDYVTAEGNGPNAETFGGAYSPETAYPGASSLYPDTSSPELQSEFFHAGSGYYPHNDPFYDPFPYRYGTYGYGGLYGGPYRYYGGRSHRDRDYFYRRDDGRYSGGYGDHNNGNRDYGNRDFGRNDGGRDNDRDQSVDRTPREPSPQAPVVEPRRDRDPRQERDRQATRDRNDTPRAETPRPTRDATQAIEERQARERQSQQRESRQRQVEQAAEQRPSRSDRNEAAREVAARESARDTAAAARTNDRQRAEAQRSEPTPARADRDPSPRREAPQRAEPRREAPTRDAGRSESRAPRSEAPRSSPSRGGSRD